jgi:hypothetical protein
MQHKSWMLILALVCAPVASKADLCFNYEGGGGTHVGKDFTLTDDIARNVNRCAPFNSFEDGGLGGAITGTGCIAEDGGTFILHYSYHSAFPLRSSIDSYFESGFCRFQFHARPLPAPGGCRGTVVTGKVGQVGRASSFRQGATIFKCDVKVPGGVVP